MARVVLAMSGGVDSSVAAHLLIEQGHEVIGLFMRHGESSPVACDSPLSLPVVSARPDHKQGCCSASDALDARRVADRLGIAFYALNFEQEFGQIINYFVEEYTAGRTPNPCVVCNNWLKFGKLCDYADSIGAQYVATGHYARLEPGNPPVLRRGLDDGKDQSYVLFGIERQVLDRVLLPVGGYRKAQIRELARGLGLRVADKRDSQEICFVADGDHAQFVRQRRGDIDLAGELVTTDGRVVGEHQGLENFTIGQRKGIGVAMGEPYFVVRLERDTHRVVIGRKEELSRSELTARATNWLIEPPTVPLRCAVKIRYLSQPAPATVVALEERRLQVMLDEPQYGVAPGQAVVCYEGDRVLGGGWIE